MRKICLYVLLLVGIAACNNAPKEEPDKNLLPTNLVSNPYTANGVDTAVMNAKPTMDFKDTLHNFGSIQEGEIVEHDFDFTNNGKSPLIISQATGSCGCTVADYQHEPIAPGKSGTLKVKFNSAGKHGHEEKSVAVSTNSKKGRHYLFITAEVISKQ